MAAKPIIPTLKYPLKLTFPPAKTLLPITLKPFKPNSLSLSVKCTNPVNNDNNENARSMGQPDIMSGMDEEILNTEDADSLMSALQSLSAEKSRAMLDQLMTTLNNNDENVVSEAFKEVMPSMESLSPQENRVLFDQLTKALEKNDDNTRGHPDIMSDMVEEILKTEDADSLMSAIQSLSAEENRAMLDQLMTTLKNNDENVVNEMFKEVKSGMESLSPEENRVLFDQFMTTLKNDDNISVGFKDFMLGMVNECLETEGIESFMSGIIGENLSREESKVLFDQLMRGLDVKKECIERKVGQKNVRLER